MNKVDLSYKIEQDAEDTADERLKEITDWMWDHKKFIVGSDSVKLTLNIKGHSVLGEITSYLGK